MDLDVDAPRLSAGQRLAALDTLLLLVLPHIDDPDPFSRACHAFHDVSLTHSAIWSWYNQRYFPCQLLFELTRRPRLVTPDLIDYFVERGATVSRAFIKAVQLAHTTRFSYASYPGLDSDHGSLFWHGRHTAFDFRVRKVPTATWLHLVTRTSFIDLGSTTLPWGMLQHNDDISHWFNNAVQLLRIGNSETKQAGLEVLQNMLLEGDGIFAFYPKLLSDVLALLMIHTQCSKQILQLLHAHGGPSSWEDARLEQCELSDAMRALRYPLHHEMGPSEIVNASHAWESLGSRAWVTETQDFIYAYRSDKGEGRPMCNAYIDVHAHRRAVYLFLHNVVRIFVGSRLFEDEHAFHNYWSKLERVRDEDKAAAISYATDHTQTCFCHAQAMRLILANKRSEGVDSQTHRKLIKGLINEESAKIALCNAWLSRDEFSRLLAHVTEYLPKTVDIYAMLTSLLPSLLRNKHCGWQILLLSRQRPSMSQYIETHFHTHDVRDVFTEPVPDFPEFEDAIARGVQTHRLFCMKDNPKYSTQPAQGHMPLAIAILSIIKDNNSATLHKISREARLRGETKIRDACVRRGIF